MTVTEKTAVMSHIAVTLLAGVVAVCVVIVTHRLSGVVDLNQITTALTTVNAPCKDNGHQVTCGTLAQVAQTTKNIGIVAAQSAEQVKQSGKLITAAATTITAAGTHANNAMDAISGTAGTASQSLTTLSAHINPAIDTANATIGDAGAAIRKLQPVEDDAARMVKDFDARVTSQDVDRALKGVADTSEQAALTTVQVTAIATDIRKAADQATAPQPWWKKILNYGTLGVNVACLATHSCPF